MVSTYPPTECGIATFAAALSRSLTQHGAILDIVQVGRTSIDGHDRALTDLCDETGSTTRAATSTFARADVVIVQHEYGIFDGLDGASIIPVLEEVDRPIIVVAHTVLERPSNHQRTVLESIVRRADAVVVMTEAGKVRLCREYGADPAQVSIIPHGAALAARADVPAVAQPFVLTWGLLGPGKGIEWMIDALALLRDVRPEVGYRVAGTTHPKIAAVEGESYREMLQHRALRQNVHARVEFDARYRKPSDLVELICQAEVVVLPYDSPDQVTSGVLVDAIAAGRPVIATAFPHAVELLSSGAGITVARKDPSALADALRMVLSSPQLAQSMATEARRLAPSLSWSSVAAQYVALGERLLDTRTHGPT